MPDRGGAHVAVILLNYNGWQDTVACVRSLIACHRREVATLSIVVCDNASPNGSLAHLERELFEICRHSVPPSVWQWQQQCRSDIINAAGARAEATAADTLVLIDNQGNLGFAAGCNVGLRWAMARGASHLWLLNNDTEVAPDALQALVTRLDAAPDIGMCGSKLVYFDHRDMVQARGGATFHRAWAQGAHIGVGESASAPDDAKAVEAQMDYVVGASMMVSRAFVERVGLMTEDYFLYYEELDWAMRGRAAGFRLAYAADSVVYHKEGATIGTSHRQRSSSLAMRYLSRNRLLFTRRFFPEHLGSVRRRMAYEALVYARRRDWGAVGALLGALVGRQVHPPPARA